MLIKRGNLNTETGTQKEDQGENGHPQAKKGSQKEIFLLQPSEGMNPAKTLTLNF